MKQAFLCDSHEVNFRLHVLVYQNFSPHVPVEVYLSSFFIASHVKLHVLVRQRHLQRVTLISICNLRLTDNWLYCFLTQYHVKRSGWFLQKILKQFGKNWKCRELLLASFSNAKYLWRADRGKWFGQRGWSKFLKVLFILLSRSFLKILKKEKKEYKQDKNVHTLLANFGVIKKNYVHVMV